MSGADEANSHGLYILCSKGFCLKSFHAGNASYSMPRWTLPFSTVRKSEMGKYYFYVFDNLKQEKQLISFITEQVNEHDSNSTFILAQDTFILALFFVSSRDWVVGSRPLILQKWYLLSLLFFYVLLLAPIGNLQGSLRRLDHDAWSGGEFCLQWLPWRGTAAQNIPQTTTCCCTRRAAALPSAAL